MLGVSGSIKRDKGPIRIQVILHLRNVENFAFDYSMAPSIKPPTRPKVSGFRAKGHLEARESWSAP